VSVLYPARFSIITVRKTVFTQTPPDTAEPRFYLILRRRVPEILFSCKLNTDEAPVQPLTHFEHDAIKDEHKKHLPVGPEVLKAGDFPQMHNLVQK